MHNKYDVSASLFCTNNKKYWSLVLWTYGTVVLMGNVPTLQYFTRTFVKTIQFHNSNQTIMPCVFVTVTQNYVSALVLLLRRSRVGFQAPAYYRPHFIQLNNHKFQRGSIQFKLLKFICNKFTFTTKTLFASQNHCIWVNLYVQYTANKLTKVI